MHINNLKVVNGTLIRVAGGKGLSYAVGIEDIKKEHDVDLSDNKMALQRIKEEAEKAKKTLSNVTSTSNDDTHLNHVENNTITSSTKIKGNGSVTVSSDNGTIIISGSGGGS